MGGILASDRVRLPWLQSLADTGRVRGCDASLPYLPDLAYANPECVDRRMSDDENAFDFENGMEEYGQMEEHSSHADSPGFLETFPKIGRAWNWWLGALDTVWAFAGVFQPLFKHTWVLFVLYMGVSGTKGLKFTDILAIGPSASIEMDEE